MRGVRAVRRHLARRASREPPGSASGRVRRRGPRAPGRGHRHDRGQLLQAGRRGAARRRVAQGDRGFARGPVLALPHAKGGLAVQRVGERRVRGRRHERRAGPPRAEGAARVRGLAGRGGRHQARRLHPLRQRPLDRGRQQRRRDEPHQGRGRNDGRAQRRDARRRRAARAEGRARAHRGAGGDRPDRRARRQEDRAWWSS